eukprot:GCRY01000618.1.p1 GENE.GCRY01000618.1~~GCRY01000618.1.p1  ORF type:complete len:286 (+),score=21.22 GCRY01000618.1:61-858(+)
MKLQICIFFSLLFCFQTFSITVSPSNTVNFDEIAVDTISLQNQLRFKDGSSLTTAPYLREEVDKIAAEKNKYPFRFPASQLHSGEEGWFRGWFQGNWPNNIVGGAPQFEFEVSASTEWSKRSTEEQLLLTAMGRYGARYLYAPFKVFSLRFNESTITENYPWLVTPYFAMPIIRDQPITCASFCKVVEGDFVDYYLAKHPTDGTWGLCGRNIWPTTGAYMNTHPQQLSNRGEVWIALPACVYGYVDLSNPLHWFYFPALPDNPYY